MVNNTVVICQKFNSHSTCLFLLSCPLVKVLIAARAGLRRTPALNSVMMAGKSMIFVGCVSPIESQKRCTDHNTSCSLPLHLRSRRPSTCSSPRPTRHPCLFHPGSPPPLRYDSFQKLLYLASVCSSSWE